MSISEKLGSPPFLPHVKISPSMHELSLTITVATPMVGGEVEAGIVDDNMPVRVPSIRGHLRYWWRMMNLSNPSKGTRESEIWGSTENPSQVYADVPKQPNVLLRYCDNNFDFRDKFGPEIYALFASRQNRQNIARENFSFTLTLKYPQEYHDDVRLTLSAWLYFGGIGARTRRGCGSLSCDKNPADLHEILRAALYITLWKKRANDNLLVWSYAVKRYMDYRQNRNGKFGRSKWPEADSLRHMTGKYPQKHKPRDYLPLPSFPRAALGLPIIFQFSPDDKHSEPHGVQLIPKIEGSCRMSSPVITKALRYNGAWYSAVIILPHDEIFGTKLKLVTPLRLTHTEDMRPLNSGDYTNLEATQRLSDAISGFEKYISGDFTREAVR